MKFYVKKIFKTLAILLVFGCAFAYLISMGLDVRAAESKYIDIVSGTGRNVGDEVRIGDEHFYVINNNGVEIKMLAKYNIDISAKCTYNGETAEPTATSYHSSCGVRTSSTQLQNSSVTGYPYGETRDVIGVPFATNRQHGTNFNDYEGSVVQLYVREYVAKLHEKYGIEVTGELLSDPEYTKLFDNDNHSKMNENLKKYSTVSFWTAVQGEDYNGDKTVKMIDGADHEEFELPTITFLGVRPVIIAPASALKEDSNHQFCDGVLCFRDANKDSKVSTSDEICIRDECFFVINNKAGEVKLLAKYNLDTGLTCAPSAHAGTYTSTLNGLACEDIPSAATVKQNLISRGFVYEPELGLRSYGGVSYSESTISDILVQYAEYVNSLSDANFTASLPTIEDLQNAVGTNIVTYVSAPKSSAPTKIGLNGKELLGVEATTYILNRTSALPEWVYANSYWTETTHGTDSIYAVTYHGYATTVGKTTIGEFGIRPLLTMNEADVPAADKKPNPDPDDSACYVCGDEYVWTDSPDLSSCRPSTERTDEKSCVNNPTTGVSSNSIMVMIILSLSIITLALMSRLNRFKKI